MNSFIFDFSGGLTDQFRMFMHVYEFTHTHTHTINNYKIYFNINNCGSHQGGFKLLNFNIKKYVDFEMVELPFEILKVFNDTKNYIYSYPDYSRRNYKMFCDNAIYSNKDINPPIIMKILQYSDPEIIYANELRDAMTLITPLNETNKEKLAKIKSCNSVCIHVRRGDMLSSQRRGVSYNYLNRAIREMIKKTGWKEITFFVFTQDFEWFKKGIDFTTNINKNIKVNVDYVEINSDSDSQFELELMKNCQHYITSIGGFTWIPTFLNTNPKKIIIKPNRSLDDDWENS
jgi:uncharacterized protein YneR